MFRGSLVKPKGVMLMSDNYVIDGVNYGPLALLVGTWRGDKGMDVSPEPDGQEDTPYFETITFEIVGDLTNAKSQKLAVISYHQVVSRKATGEVFHDEIGYWMWDEGRNTVMHSLAIPRAVCVLAGGVFAGPDGADSAVIEVKAADGDADWGIVQSPFMRDSARTSAFSHRVEVNGDQLSYSETTVLEIYGKTFDHTDGNTLNRVQVP